MNYETFLNISQALTEFIKKHYARAFCDFGKCVQYNLLDIKNIDQFRDIKYIWKRTMACRNEKQIPIEVLSCALILIRYKQETFENAKGDRLKVSFLMQNRHVHDITLLEEAKALHNFMMSV